MGKRYESFSVRLPSCESCGQAHLLTGRYAYDPADVYFGGDAPTPQAASETHYQLSVVCPTNAAEITVTFALPTVAGVLVHKVEAQLESDVEAPARDPVVLPAPQDAAGTDWIGEELAAWRKNSVGTLRTFATTMMTTSLTAVGVHFAIVKFFGLEKSLGNTVSTAAAVPPILLVVAAAAFALALQPRAGEPVTAGEFLAFRERQLRRMARCSMAGFAVLLTAVLADIVLFTVML